MLVKPDTIVKAGTELWPGNFAKLSGLLQLDEITQELVIKAGELFIVTEEHIKKKFEIGSFVKPGSFIFQNLVAEKLCYVELFELLDVSYLLVRPVQSFQVPREKGFLLEHCFFPAETGHSIKLKTVKRIFFKNWERVKSNNGVNLLQTFLVLQVKTINSNLQPQFEMVPLNGLSRTFGVKVSLYEVFKPSETVTKYFKQNIKASTNYLIKEDQFVYPNTEIAQLQVSSTISGTLIGIEHSLFACARILAPQMSTGLLATYSDGESYVSFVGGGIYILVLILWNSFKQILNGDTVVVNKSN